MKSFENTCWSTIEGVHVNSTMNQGLINLINLNFQLFLSLNFPLRRYKRPKYWWKFITQHSPSLHHLFKVNVVRNLDFVKLQSRTAT